MTRTGRLLQRAFGQLQWTPPPWLRAIGDFRRRRPGRFWGTLLAVLAVAGGGYGLQRYLASLPKPQYVSVTVYDPAPTELKPEAKPNPLVLRFSQSAAPLDRVGKQVTEDFTVTPPLPGTWTWEESDRLVFRPAEDWPVGQKYELKMGERFLARHILIEDRTAELHSPPITADIAGREFWEDPVDPRNKRAAFTVRFTHPVDKAAFEKRVSLRMKVDPEEKFDGPGSRALDFKVTYDEVGAKAFVHSEPIAIPERPGTVRLTLDDGVKAARGGEGTAKELETTVSVPGAETYFRVSGATLGVVTGDDHRIERVLTLDLTGRVTVDSLRPYVEVWELPVDRPAVGDREEQKDYAWRDAAEVVPEVLARARRLEPVWLPSEPEWSKQQSFKIEATGGRSLYVRVEKGARAHGGYELVRPYTTLVKADELPRTVEILHEGSVLALSGGRKLSVLARNLPAVEIELARLLPSSIAHLTSQTSGSFQEPVFDDWSFGIDNLSEIFREERVLAKVLPGQPQYEAVDVGAMLSSGSAPRGLFQLRVTGWDPVRKERIADAQARRIVLVTDLGFLVKDAADGSSDVFVMSVATGSPVADAEVRLLGKNGVPVLSRRTDAEGRAAMPEHEGLERERTPVAYVVEKDGDLSFLPYGRYDRRVDLSRFDTGGLHDESELRSLQAYLFSDRGVYRPGETVTMGIIVKPLDWTPLPPDLPLEIVVSDPRYRELRSERITMPAAGLRDFQFQTFEASPTGLYTVELYIVRDGERHGLIGEARVRVEEFLPDRMTITTQLTAPPSPGWVSPDKLGARASLRNLVGTPAVGNKVKGTLRLSPSYPQFPRWKDWSFFDPATARQSFDETLSELKTNEAGEAEFALNLERFERATYRLRFLAEGFEAEGNRSVTNDAGAIVSPLPYLVAWKSDGDLFFIRKGTPRKVAVIAVGPALDPVAPSDVSAELVEVTYVTVLAKQENGLLSYQSVKKEIPRGTRPITPGAEPFVIDLPTESPGRFFYVFRDGGGTELNRVTFDVVGEGNVAGRVERNAELKVTLARTEYSAGEEIEVAIQAPYAGAGLITIERDRVYASRWFRAAGNSALERITVPPELEGNGYVVVTFVRDIGSRDIFTSPASSGAAPFGVSRARRTQSLTLDVADRALPGTPLRLGWNAPVATRLAVFAVDEGILQVARWKTPDPLSHFFRKRALEVNTSQILDLLLPEYEIVRSLAATGGDEDAGIAGNLNPFKRKGQPPVAYWSGILDVPAGPGSVEYVVPDTFHGTLRVTAVAVSEGAVGVAEDRALVRGPFIVQPTIPYFAAPGDEFEVTALVTNALEDGSGRADVRATLTTTPQLEVLGEREQTLSIATQRDGVVRWRVRATDQLGSAVCTFAAESGPHRAGSTLEMSIRPATPLLTTVATAAGDDGGELAVRRVLFPQHRSVVAATSASPLAIVSGLARYLLDYPHMCVEQLLSSAIPAMLLESTPDLAVDRDKASAAYRRAITALQARQNGEGAFGIWDADDDVSPFLSAYAVHFLLEARSRGLAVPETMFRRAIGRLESHLSPRSDLRQLRAQAYGIYLLTRHGQIRTKEARALRDMLVAKPKGEWRGDIAAAFLAATFAQLNLHAEAERLLDGVSVDRELAADWSHYYDPLTEHGLVLYLLARHFPDRVRELPSSSLLAWTQELSAFNTLSAGALMLGLDAYAQLVPPQQAAAVTITAVAADGTTTALPTTGTVVRTAAVADNTTAVRFGAPSAGTLFYQLTETGFDRTVPAEPVANGLEVTREIRGADGKPATQCSITDRLTVELAVRSTDDATREVALVDLLPGGFEVDLIAEGMQSRTSAGGGAERWQPDYVDAREDRVVLYGNVGKDAKRFAYRIKPTNRGRYLVPPVQVEGFYDRAAWGRGPGGEIVVGD